MNITGVEAQRLAQEPTVDPLAEGRDDVEVDAELQRPASALEHDEAFWKLAAQHRNGFVDLIFADRHLCLAHRPHRYRIVIRGGFGGQLFAALPFPGPSLQPAERGGGTELRVCVRDGRVAEPSTQLGRADDDANLNP